MAQSVRWGCCNHNTSPFIVHDVKRVFVNITLSSQKVVLSLSAWNTFNFFDFKWTQYNEIFYLFYLTDISLSARYLPKVVVAVVITVYVYVGAGDLGRGNVYRSRGLPRGIAVSALWPEHKMYGCVKPQWCGRLIQQHIWKGAKMFEVFVVYSKGSGGIIGFWTVTWLWFLWRQDLSFFGMFHSL